MIFGEERFIKIPTSLLDIIKRRKGVLGEGFWVHVDEIFVHVVIDCFSEF